MKKTIVITGSTRGIGFGLAGRFLRDGHNVVVSGRSNASTDSAVAELAAHIPGGSILGHPADVTDREQVQRLWSAAVDRFDRVDIWINNAGVGTQSARFWNRSPDEVSQVVTTNVIGVMNGSVVAVSGMLEQHGGFVYNMEGLGSGGPVVPGTALYSASKAAVTQFTRALVKDTASTPVRVGFLSPGMVVTDLLTGPDLDALSTRTKKAFNILADSVDTVASYLVARILRNTRHGQRIDWLPGWKVGWRFLTAMFRKNRLFKIE